MEARLKELSVQGKERRLGACASARASLAEFAGQLKVLLAKNVTLLYRSKFSTTIQLLVPVFICFYMSIIQNITTTAFERLVNPDPVPYQVTGLAKCWGQNCTTVGVGMTSGRTE